jgi:hypothetical protein
VIELLEGQTLAARVARERVPFDFVLTWAIQAADALALRMREALSTAI